MEKQRRLSKRKEFGFVMLDGRSWVTRLLVLRGAPNGLSQTRFGFAAGRRLGGAVVRNRMKRRLREAVRSMPVRTGWDLVFVARNGAVRAGYPELVKSMGTLLRQAELL